MLQVPGPDECPRCGEKLGDCICSTMTVAARNTSPVTPTVTSPQTFPVMTVTSSNGLPVTTVNTSATPITVSLMEPGVSPSKDLSESTVVEPRVGHPKRFARASIRDRNDWEEIEDPERYTLPPIDRNLYDVQNSQSSRDKLVEPQHGRSPVSRRRPHKLKEVIVTEEEPKRISIESHDTPDEDYYKRRGCWCKDCPWLIAYIIFALIWLIILGVLWRKASFVESNHITLEDSECLLLCSELVSPSRPLDVEKTHISTFHCKKGVEKWEKDIFQPWQKVIDPRGNPNCVNDCNSYPSIGSFISACVNDVEWKDANRRTDKKSTQSLPPGSPLVFIDSIKGHWQRIVHVIVITNALSLFILLVPLFFCCPMVAFFVVASVAASLILTILLWVEMVGYIGKEDSKDKPHPSLVIAKWIFIVASTLFSGYVIFNAFMVFKRFRITCAIAGMASRVVNAVPMVLLEAILTMILLFLLIALMIFVTLGFESSTPLTVTGSEYSYEASPFLWFARIHTVLFAYWTAQMLINCQTIIVHGAMARYYFEKNMKNKVLISHKRLLKYHICTACFAGILFNWLYWIRWPHRKSRIRSRSLFGTGAFGLCFCPASRVVKNLVFMDGNITRKIDKANPYFFLVQILVVMTVAIVCHLVFSGAYSSALWPDFLMLGYSYFVSLSAVNIFRVTKDAMFLSYEEDRTQTKENPLRNMKMPRPVSIFFGYEPRVSPR